MRFHTESRRRPLQTSAAVELDEKGQHVERDQGIRRIRDDPRFLQVAECKTIGIPFAGSVGDGLGDVDSKRFSQAFEWLPTWRRDRDPLDSRLTSRMFPELGDEPTRRIVEPLECLGDPRMKPSQGRERLHRDGRDEPAAIGGEHRRPWAEQSVDLGGTALPFLVSLASAGSNTTGSPWAVGKAIAHAPSGPSANADEGPIAISPATPAAGPTSKARFRTLTSPTPASRAFSVAISPARASARCGIPLRASNTAVPFFFKDHAASRFGIDLSRLDP